jgi:hypothetical protein
MKSHKELFEVLIARRKATTKAASANKKTKGAKK